MGRAGQSEEIVRRWRSRQIATVDDLDTALSNFQILFAYHSNRMENVGLSYHQTREVFENGRVVDYTGDTRHIFEVQNQKECYEYLKEQIVEKDPVTPELICEIHRILMHGCYDETRWKKGERPGVYKKNYYVVGENMGVPPEDVQEELAFLCGQIDSLEESDESVHNILKSAAYLHCSFEEIHGFADGNGRVGRTLMNYFLLIHDIPPIIFYEEDKKTYYMGLAVFDKTEALDGFVEFMREQMIKTWSGEWKKGGERVRSILL